MRRTLMSWAAATVFTLRAAVSITACTSNGRLVSATVAGARVYAGNGFSEGGGGELLSLAVGLVHSAGRHAASRPALGVPGLKNSARNALVRAGW